MFWSSVPCIRSHKSAGQFIVNFVTGLMVGDRRFLGATVLGGGSLLLPPTIPCQSRRLVQNNVMDSLSGLFWDFVHTGVRVARSGAVHCAVALS